MSATSINRPSTKPADHQFGGNGAVVAAIEAARPALFKLNVTIRGDRLDHFLGALNRFTELFTDFAASYCEALCSYISAGPTYHGYGLAASFYSLRPLATLMRIKHNNSSHTPTLVGIGCFVVCSLCSSLMAQTTINVKDLASEGVSLVPSTSGGFAGAVAGLIGTTSSDSAKMLPYSVVLRNATNQTIRGYALRWNYVDKSGGTDANYQVEQNFDSRHKGAEIGPGEACILSPTGPIRSSSGPSLRTTASVMPPDPSAKLANQAVITISLDSVAFDNGKVIGPNEGFAVKIWGAMYSAQRDVGVATLTRNQNSSIEAVVAWLTAQAEQPETFSSNAGIDERLAGSSHWYQVYSAMAFKRLVEFSGRSTEAMLNEAKYMAETPVPALTQ